ncbi:DNA polymeras-like protein zeta catalytic subunit [Amniculicola lignicola CBS 123094]|uniref:DNA polymerase n=1 Tax=Amniculicola lignicola CBS 123094 TaxID=1392246 RepID=A0A6A5X2H7_9PLEO|nr:DNA polymeras-like protein zeta catalytic subunit [Amniculicola lignicola CBS 123094]
METFRFRLNCIDHYQAIPTDLDPVLRRSGAPSQRQNAPPVPVIRVFGATETGQKVCAHIHGALPYLYIEYNGSLEQETVDAHIAVLRASIDHALAGTFRRNPYDAKAVYVGHISLIKGVPFFGYNVGYKYFLKIYMLNPFHMTRFADLLYQGAILNRVFQPYESHLQYLLQWMCDYNLFGCAYIHCSKAHFRSPVPDSDEIDTTTHRWHDSSIPPSLISESDQYPRQSHCTLEVDICTQDILNRHELSSRPIHHNFLERFENMNPDDKFVPSMAGLWRDETRRRKLRMGLTDPSSSPFPAEVLVSMSADPRNTNKGGWIHEDEYREILAKLVSEERGDRPPVAFDTYVQPPGGGENTKTALESVEDLYPENFKMQGHSEEKDNVGKAVVDDSIVQDNLDHEVQDVEEQGGDLGEETKDQDEVGMENQSYGGNHASLDPLSVSEALLASQGQDVRTGEDNDEGIDMSEGDYENQSGGSTSSRKRQQDVSESNPSKRQRVLSQDNTSQGSFQNDERANLTSDRLTVVQHDTQDMPFRPSQLSQSKTILRLSQSGYSNSQETPKTPAGKPSLLKPSTATPFTPWSNQKTSPVGVRSSGMQPQGEAIALVNKLGKSTKHATQTLYYGFLPPSAEVIESTMMSAGLPPVLYQDAYYSDEADVPERPREYAGREFKLQSTSLPYLPIFDPSGVSPANTGDHPPVLVDKPKGDRADRMRSYRCNLRHWEIAAAPPSFTGVESWLQSQSKLFTSKVPKSKGKPKPVKPDTELSQIKGPTQKNKHGFKFSQKRSSTSVKHDTQYMSILSLEVHVNSRGTLVPDPAEDEIQCIFWCIQGEEDAIDDRPRVGVLCLSEDDGIAKRIAKQVAVEVEYEDDELELINRMVDIVRQFDPDILTGYEVHNGSWGYLIERARMKYEYDLCDEISRMKSQSHGRFGKEADRWGFTHTSTIRVTGRHMINIWRAMRGELNLLQYTMENIVFHLLHKRIPHYPHSDLTAWYTSSKPRDLAKTLNYFISRVQLNLDILEANEIVPRTSEQARLLGVDFFSVISRGSQFKVESTMFRIAKPENFILVSPSRKQVGQQNALECIPLVMEPQSAFYASPLLVLDFQSLYPSVMIAYNYCYSTCLGRIVSWRGRNKMGFMDFKREPQLLELVKDYINIAPNGMMYVKPEMRKSLLAKMLGEILETRVMVKSGMKQDKDDKTLQQLLNNRQLALKLLANVTYGYTSASFSGRMPCSEIADSIVQTGRETLEKAIALIHSIDRWGAEVVYGDTDSLFVYLKGRTRDQAFAIGEEIAEAVTKANPRPIKLKFEKVYHPCVLLAKKRYVGFKYEHRNQTEPDFDAKGIETVRRDGTPVEQKIEEKALKILFRTSDLSEVKRYFQSQCTKIMSGRVSIQDFLFAKEVKLGTYSDRGPPPPGALIAAKRMLADPRTEPQYGERVPYVVITGAPGARLIDRCVSPETLLQSDHIELDAEYYISKNLIPPLERIFNLVGANVRQWFDEMPKIQRIRNISIPLSKPEVGNGGALMAGGAAQGLRKTLESYMKSSTCLVCRSKLLPPLTTLPGLELDAFAMLPLCSACLARPATALLSLKERVRKNEEKAKQVDMVCRSCSGLAWGEEIKCDSRDCPVFYTRIRERSKLASLKEGVERVAEVIEAKNDDWIGEGMDREGLEW